VTGLQKIVFFQTKKVQSLYEVCDVEMWIFVLGHCRH